MSAKFFSEEHSKLSEVMEILSYCPISVRRMYAREHVAKALCELEAEHFDKIKAELGKQS